MRRMPALFIVFASFLIVGASPRAQTIESCLYGDRAIQTGDFQGAVDHYTACLKTEGQSEENQATAHVRRSQAYSELEEYGSAIGDLDAAAALDPEDHMIPYDRAKVWLLTGDTASAIGDLTMVIDMAPDFAGAYNQRGLVFMQLDEFAAAIADFSVAIELRPDIADGFQQRGYAYLLTEEYALAVADYDSFMELSGGDLIAFRLRALAKAGTGDADGAFEDVLISWRLDPVFLRQDQQTLLNLGFYDGDINGSETEETVAAMKEWLRSRGEKAGAEE